MKARVRFAPSPTGFLHLGGARTALFNFLFARKEKGSFILRIEDTDISREVKGAEEEIVSSLHWLGLNWDEGPDVGGEYGPYRQSQRKEFYQQKLAELKKKGVVYPCFCSPGKAPDTSVVKTEACSCSELGAAEVAKLSRVAPFAWRFRVPKGKIKWKDLLKGEIEMETSYFCDFVVVRSDGKPTFHFAVVVDDALMNITHVIRGEDHLTNTLYHLLLYQALELSPPLFAHLPLLIEKEGGKLSKREESLTISQLKKEGFLPEAILNYLVLTGWSPGIERMEVLSLAEMIDLFSLERVGKAPGVFDRNRLNWLNREHLRRADAGRARELIAFLGNSKWQKISEHPRFNSFFEMVKENLLTLRDLESYAQIFLFEDLNFSQEQIDLVKSGSAKKLLREMEVLIKVEGEFQKETAGVLVEKVRKRAKSLGQPPSLALKLLRVVLTAREEGPPLADVLSFYGKEKTLSLIRKASEG